MCGTCVEHVEVREYLVNVSTSHWIFHSCSHRWAATILSPEFITTLANAHHIPYLLWCGSKPSFVKFVRRFEYRAHCCSYRGCCGRRRDRETPGTSRNEYEKSDKKWASGPEQGRPTLVTLVEKVVRAWQSVAQVTQSLWKSMRKERYLIQVQWTHSHRGFTWFARPLLGFACLHVAWPKSIILHFEVPSIWQWLPTWPCLPFWILSSLCSMLLLLCTRPLIESIVESPRLRRRFGRGKAQRWCQKCRVEARHEIILKLSRDFDVLQSWRLYLKQWGKIRDASTAQQKGGASCSFKRTNCTWQHWLSNNVTFDTSFDKILQNTLCSQ